MRIRPALIGPFGPPQLACIRSWKSRGLDPIFIHLSSKGGSGALKRYIPSYYHLEPSKLNNSAEVALLAEFLTNTNATGITCVADHTAAWLHANREILPERLQYWVQSTALMEKLDSKAFQLDLARNAGFNVLPTWLIGLGDSVDAIDTYPLVARPDSPAATTPALKVQLLNSAAEFRTFLNQFKAIDRPLVVQPLVKGPNMVVHGYRTAKTGDSTFHAFIVEHKYEGVTLTMRSIGLQEPIEAACRHYCELLEIQGCFHFELIQDAASKIWYFLEINGRLGGTTAKALRLGYDEPNALLIAFDALKPDDGPDKQNSKMVVSNRRAMAKFTVNFISGRTTSLDYGENTPRQTFLSILRGWIIWRDEIFNLSDLPGTWTYEMQQLSDWLKTTLSRP
jgi:hypothetical protein